MQIKKIISQIYRKIQKNKVNKSCEKKYNKKNLTKKIILILLSSLILNTLLTYSLIKYMNNDNNISLDKINNDYKKNNTYPIANINLNEKNIIQENITKTYPRAKKSIISIQGFKKNHKNTSINIKNTGSGIIYQIKNNKIYIITNYHVVEDVDIIELKTSSNTDMNPQFILAKIIGQNKENDLAILETEFKPNLEIEPALIGNSNNIKIGESIYVIGNPLNLGVSITFGIVSSMTKITNPIQSNLINVIQTDAAINSGNSGGAVLNSKSEVIGVTSSKIKQIGAEGLGFALPINEILYIANSIINNHQNFNNNLDVLQLK